MSVLSTVPTVDSAQSKTRGRFYIIRYCLGGGFVFFHVLGGEDLWILRISVYDFHREIPLLFSSEIICSLPLFQGLWQTRASHTFQHGVIYSRAIYPLLYEQNCLSVCNTMIPFLSLSIFQFWEQFYRVQSSFSAWYKQNSLKHIGCLVHKLLCLRSGRSPVA